MTHTVRPRCRQVVYRGYKAPKVIFRKRDVVFVKGKAVDDDGTIHYASMSVEHADKPPTTGARHYIRMDRFAACFDTRREDSAARVGERARDRPSIETYERPSFLWQLPERLRDHPDWRQLVHHEILLKDRMLFALCHGIAAGDCYLCVGCWVLASA